MNKRVGIVLVLLAVTLVAAAKPPRVATVVKTWQMPGYSAVADTIPFRDTVMLNYHDVDVQNDYSLSSATNGNVLVSHIESRIIQDRQRTIEDPFAWSLTPYVLTPQQQRFFNTTTPFSTIAYKKGFVTGHEENDIDFLFTGNIGKALNLGLEMDYLNSVGHYSNTAGKLFRGSVWGSYNGAHYSMHGAFSWSQLSSYDNGGLKDIEDMRGPLDPEDMPVRMNAMTGYRYLSGYLHNQYAITKEREYHDSIEVVEDGRRVKHDTIKVEYIPLMTFSHLFETNNSNRRYIEKTANQGFYNDIYFDSIATHDTTDVLTIRNTIAVTFCEAYNTKLKFGITAFAMNECQRFLRDSVPYDPDSIFDYKWTNNTFVGGAIHKHSGANVRYHVEGKVCVVGYKIGEFDVHGKLQTHFNAGKYPMYISARAYAKSETPNWYLQHFQSNHVCWENDFGFTYRFLGGATISYPTKWVKARLDFSFENQTHPIYVSATDWKPRQYSGNVQIITGDVGVDVTTPWVNLENRAVIQHSTNDSVMAVPLVILQHRLYYHGTWFKALDAQIGVDVRYFTRYHAPILCPATGMFAAQTDTKIGNYPWMNVYANFYVRSIRLRFFAQYQHINRLFMKDNIDYLTMPDYPTNRDVFRAGLAWHFYN
ncbi:MAG: putative porin [Paludibacteraceae bacterium]|nr:putative porin [Paludibacteraceae bacterium]